MPSWFVVAVFFAAALTLVPVLFRAWLDRFRAARRTRTQALVMAHANATASPPREAQVDGEKSAVLEDRPLR